MDPSLVQRTEEGRPFVMGRMKNPRGEWYSRRVYGAMSVCISCGLEFFYRDSQRHGSQGKFCSIRCSRVQVHNPMWKGGRFKTPDGYIRLVLPDRRVLEHRYVMERHVGRPLERSEWVHHRNGVKDDNRIENLEIVTHSRANGWVLCPHCRKGFQVH